MITKDNFKKLLNILKFSENNNIFSKKFNDYELQVDFNTEKLIYPEDLVAQRDTTKNFTQPENFVVFECVYNLFDCGYKPKNIVLEQGMPGGHGMTGGFCDIIVQDNNNIPYLLIECKTSDDKKSKEFSKAWNKMLKDGGQLFNYYNSYRQAQWICLYTSDLDENIENITSTYHLISMKDNDEYLQTNTNLRSFKEVADANSGKEEFFKVWKETYQCDFISHNLFESEVFKIGNRPFGIQDLKVVDGDIIQKKYHQFATIMRQHNVSGRENAFDKLVNLFLCKVVDENKNPDNLKVYWKGAASDDHFSLQDRLQKLYKTGMYEFLGEDVTYIEESEIENAFKLFKNKKDETKKTIMEYFKQLKFYSNNAFAFLEVHNKDLFLQNAIILKEVVQMLQDIRLKNEDEQNQFLGDLFEGFLDQGVKQSEGQFFTPMPIVKFLVSSLPLNHILNEETTPKVIDYACGAGHFLTEYASQAKDIIGKEKKEKLKLHYGNIYGIEKEYRLSKVAKISAFMYGQDQINIIYADALAQHRYIKEKDFSILIANPPYSVKGFLTTLSDEDKQKYYLYKDISEDSFNSIETFFIERAKQLLRSGGVAAIILPSSVLTNGSIYVKCREIILKFFDLVAITEFGSGTFGKTGTNTVAIFIRRKSSRPDIAEHYKNRVEGWFNGDFNADTSKLFEDEYLLRSYCQHCEYNFEEYKNFLQGKEEGDILKNKIFLDYKRSFENESSTKNLKSKSKFKSLREEEQEEILKKELIKFIKEIEKDKAYFYILAKENNTDVVVVKSPKDNKAMKNFLGYEWSNAKGSEGIKYLGTTTSEDEYININNGIKQIKTPLFNPKNLNDDSKINSYIRRHFAGESFDISEVNKEFVNILPLTDMLDFSRTTFDKAIKISAQKKIEIKSKFPLKTIEYITSSNIESGKRPSGGVGNFEEGAYSLGGEHIGKDNGRLDLSSIKYVPMSFFNQAQKGIVAKNDILLCKDGALTGKVCIVRNELDGISAMVNEHVFILRCKNIDTQKYLFNFLYSELGQELLKINITGSAQGGLNSTNLKNIKIPMPPIDIQKQIVKECEKVDSEYENSRMSIEDYRAKIAQVFHDLEVLEKNNQGGVKCLKMNTLCSFNPHKKEIENIPDSTLVSFIEMSSVSNNGYIENKVDKELGKLRKGTYTYFKSEDILIAKITPCMENGKSAIATNLTNNIGMGSSEFHVFRAFKDKISSPFLFYSLNRDEIRKEAEKNMTGASGHRRVPISFYEDLYLIVPPPQQQQDIVTEIQKYESEIKKHEEIMKQSAFKKQAILKKYL